MNEERQYEVALMAMRWLIRNHRNQGRYKITPVVSHGRNMFRVVEGYYCDVNQTPRQLIDIAEALGFQQPKIIAGESKSVSRGIVRPKIDPNTIPLPSYGRVR